MTWIDFLAQYLALVLASLTVFAISLGLGYFSIKHLINKAMRSKEIVEAKKTLEELQKIGETVIKEIEKVFDPTKREGYQG